jgi:hypothetical protein
MLVSMSFVAWGVWRVVCHRHSSGKEPLVRYEFVQPKEWWVWANFFIAGLKAAGKGGEDGFVDEPLLGGVIGIIIYRDEVIEGFNQFGLGLGRRRMVFGPYPHTAVTLAPFNPKTPKITQPILFVSGKTNREYFQRP